MAYIIPLEPSKADYVFSTVLDGDTYNFRVRWNVRGGVWFFDISDAFQAPIATSIAILLGPPLGMSQSHLVPFLLGSFIVIDTSGGDRDAGFDDIGTRVVLKYFTIADLWASALRS